MKPKKLLALLLSVVLMVSMIPMNAMAALTPGSGVTENIYKIELSVSDTANKVKGSTISTANNAVALRTWYNGINGTAITEASDEATIKSNISKMNDLFDGSTSASGVPDTYVFVGVKISGKNLGTSTAGKQYKGISGGAMVVMKYDGTKLAPAAANRIFVNKALTTSAFSSSAIEDAFGYNDETMKPLLSKYYGNLSTPGRNIQGSGAESYLALEITQANGAYTCYIPQDESIEYDVIVPFEVKAGAKGSAKIECVMKADSSASATFVTREMGWDGDAGAALDVTQSPDNDNFAITATQNNTHFESNDVTINIVSNDASIALSDNKYAKIPAVTGDATTEIQVTSTNAKINDNPDKTKWVVSEGTNSTGATATVDSVTKVDDNTAKIVLKDAAAGSADGKIKITANNDQFTLDAGKTAPADGYVVETTIVAAPDTTQNTVVEEKTDGTIEVKSDYQYQLGDATTWTDGKVIPEADLLEAIGTDAGTDNNDGTVTHKGLIKIQKKTENGTMVYSTMDVKQYKAPTIATGTSAPTFTTNKEITVDYEGENAYIGTGLKYTIGTAAAPGTANAGTGASPVALTTALNDTGKTLTVYAAGDATAVKSADVTVALTRPAAPTPVVSTTTDTQIKNGKTQLSGLTSGDKYTIVVDGSTKPAASAINTAYTAAVEIAADGNDTIFAITPGSNTTKKFASAISEGVTGAGSQYSTVELDKTSITEGATTVKVKIYNGTWNANESGIKVNDGTNDVSTGAAVNSSDPTILDITTSALVKGKTYTVTIPSAATSKGLTGGNAFTDSKRISADGVKLTIKDDKGNAVTVDKDVVVGSDEEVNYTATIPGYTIKSVANTTAANGTATRTGDKTFKYVAETVTGEDLPDTVTLTLEPVALTYDKTSSTVEYGETATFTVTTADMCTGNYSISGNPNGVTFNTSTGEVTVGNTTAKGDYTMTVTAPNGATATLSLEVTGQQATPDFSSYTKTWDGTNTVDLSGIKFKDSSGNEIAGLTAGGKATFASTDASDSFIAIDVSGMTIQGATAGNYEIPSSPNAGSGVTAYQGKITKAPFASAKTVDYSTKVKSITVADLATALMAQKVVPTTGSKSDETETATLGTLVGNTASVIENLIITEIQKTDATCTDNTYEIKPKLELNLSLPQGSITATAGYFKNIEDVTTGTGTVSIKATVNKKSTSTGTQVPTITLETSDFGEANGQAVVDETGKITSLPTITNLKKGIVFRGWSTNGTATRIVKEGDVIEGDTTLYPVFEGYMNGYPDGTAGPKLSVTRAELVTMLVRASGIYDPDHDYGTPTYTDAQVGWYVPYIACAEQANILTGYKDGTVRPGNNITRNEAVILIAKTFNVVTSAGATTDKVSDFAEIPTWASDYVAALCNNGTIGGYPDGTFKGNNNITRGEAAQMINIYLGLSEEGKAALAADSSVESPFTDVQDRNDWNFPNMVFATANAPISYYSLDITQPTGK